MNPVVVEIRFLGPSMMVKISARDVTPLHPFLILPNSQVGPRLEWKDTMTPDS